MDFTHEERDENGFILLKRKSKNKNEKENKQKSRLSNPFKMGSRRWCLFKMIKKHKPMSRYSQFHNIDQISYFMARKKDKIFRAIGFKKPLLKRSEITMCKDDFLMINIGNSTYAKLSVKSYKLLSEIEKMVINYRLIAIDDSGEKYEVYSKNIIIDSINDLLNWINYYRQLIDGVGEIQADCCSFTYYKYRVSSVVFKTDDRIESYKGDFNDFMKKYDLLPF